MFCGLQSNKCRKRYSRNCTGEAPVAHTFSKGFFGLEDEPVKSVKIKVETRSGRLWRLPHEFALCSLQFRFALRVSVMFHCVEPHSQKKR